MLGSFSSSISHDQDPREDVDHLRRCHRPMAAASAGLLPLPPAPRCQHSPRQLLVRCAELISANDVTSAHCILSYLRSTAAGSPYGDSTERLVHLFAKALSLCITRDHVNDIIINEHDYEDLNPAYLSVNQVTPFIRFSHLTANQAILEAVSGHGSVHIVDFNLLQGLQWPPLMQALTSNPNRPAPTLRISATGSDPVQLQKTGSRLRKFALSLGLKFHFHPVLLSARDPASFLSSVTSLPGEALAVNAVHFLHRLLDDDERSSSLIRLLDKIKSMSPKIVTVSEREAGHDSRILAARVEAAVEHYSAVMESMEATLPPNSKERMAVEQAWFGREIFGVVMGSVRHARFGAWEKVMRESGFQCVGLSGFSVSQAKLLMRLHYPSEGYRLHVLDDGKGIFLGWQNCPLFSVSSWR